MQPSPELRDLINAWFKSAAHGDAACANDHISRNAGTRLVGTAPSEWLEPISKPV
jgi:hypothetical protein